VGRSGPGRRVRPVPRVCRSGQEHLTDRQRARLVAAIEVDPRHDEVHIA